MAQINLGKIKPLWRGAYSAATTYKPLDFVSYNGLIYICAEVTTGNAPTNTAFWDTIVDGLGTAITYDVTTSPADTTAGRLTKVGDYGMGTGVTRSNEYSTGRDFNNFLISGLYFIGGANNLHTPLGLPTGAYSLLVNNNQSSHNYIEHTATLISTEIPRKFFRCRINATWTDWKEIYHTGSTDITGSSSQTVGTQGADPFAIKTNNIERARVSSGGNYLIGTTTDNGVDKLQVNGSIQFKPATVSTPTNNGDLTVEATSNTEVKIKLKGTDGVVRSVSLTLA